jgi:hypothetical protein
MNNNNKNNNNNNNHNNNNKNKGQHPQQDQYKKEASNGQKQCHPAGSHPGGKCDKCC